MHQVLSCFPSLPLGLRHPDSALNRSRACLCILLPVVVENVSLHGRRQWVIFDWISFTDSSNSAIRASILRAARFRARISAALCSNSCLVIDGEMRPHRRRSVRRGNLSMCYGCRDALARHIRDCRHHGVPQGETLKKSPPISLQG